MIILLAASGTAAALNHGFLCFTRPCLGGIDRVIALQYPRLRLLLLISRTAAKLLHLPDLPLHLLVVIWYLVEGRRGLRLPRPIR